MQQLVHDAGVRLIRAVDNAVSAGKMAAPSKIAASTSNGAAASGVESATPSAIEGDAGASGGDGRRGGAPTSGRVASSAPRAVRRERRALDRAVLALRTFDSSKRLQELQS